jgi:hypothetical protein
LKTAGPLKAIELNLTPKYKFLSPKPITVVAFLLIGNELNSCTSEAAGGLVGICNFTQKLYKCVSLPIISQHISVLQNRTPFLSVIKNLVNWVN